MIKRQRLVPLIVAVALFMENMDSTVISTSLPAIAVDIGTNPLALKLAITSYLLALAIFIPASGWMADRFGARTVFSAAIVVFVSGSIACAFSQALEHFVVARFLQGMGGAMMTPVGRLILVRTVSRTELVRAMALMTTPAVIGPLLGPPLGGFITTYLSWHWIFFINVPIGMIGFVLVQRFVENVRGEEQARFDFVGMILVGVGVGGLAFGASVLGLGFLPAGVVVALIVGGATSTFAYVLHARRTPAPVLDLSLLQLPTLRASVVGGSLFRIGAGAMPFLLPLLLQIGFHMTPFQSGLITFATAIGALSNKAVIARVLARYGFRTVLTGNALIASAFVAAGAVFALGLPVPAIILTLLVSGFFRSLQFTSLNIIAFADVDPAHSSRATSLVSVAQQLSMSIGVATGAFAVETTLRLKGEPTMTASDFIPAFLVVAAIAASSAVLFARLPANAGAELTRRRPVSERADRSSGVG
jgi:EmrB/QacA subfamily drug resistance transporter